MHPSVLRSSPRHRALGGFTLVALFGVGLLLGGCLPPEEETLGEAPPGVVVAYYFDSGAIPAELVANITGNSAGGGWIIDNGTGGSGSGPGSLSSGTSAFAVGPDEYCIALIVAQASSYVEFEYTFISGGGEFQFRVDAAVTTVTGSDVAAWTFYTQSPTSGPHTYQWCLYAPGTTGGMNLHIDDIEVWP